jgi:ABC-type multidrug transport system permease subunit
VRSVSLRSSRCTGTRGHRRCGPDEVIDIPGFVFPGSYLAYLIPGIVAMNAMSGNMRAGLSMIEEIDRGTLNRFLVTPASRLAIGRSALSASPDWPAIAVRGGALLVLAVSCVALSVRTFRRYGKNV